MEGHACHEGSAVGSSTGPKLPAVTMRLRNGELELEDPGFGSIVAIKNMLVNGEFANYKYQLLGLFWWIQT